MKDSIKYVTWYLLVYVVLTVIYGLAQKHYICSEMAGYICNFDEDKLISFLTITAYIITPAVAICGFQGWKKQENKMLMSKEAKDLQLQAAKDIENLAQIVVHIRKLNIDQSEEEQLKVMDEIQKLVNSIYENKAEDAKNISLFYELTGDKKIRDEAHKVIDSMHKNIEDFLYSIRDSDIETAKEKANNIEKTCILSRKYRINLLKYIKHT